MPENETTGAQIASERLLRDTNMVTATYIKLPGRQIASDQNKYRVVEN